MFNNLYFIFLVGLVTFNLLSDSAMASEEDLPVLESVEKLQTTKEALSYIEKLSSIAERTMQNFVDSETEDKIRIDTVELLKSVDNPVVLSKIATISWVITFPQTASQRTFDVVYDFAFQSAIQRLGEINSAESKIQLQKISATIVIGPFEKKLIDNSLMSRRSGSE